MYASTTGHRGDHTFVWLRVTPEHRASRKTYSDCEFIEKIEIKKMLLNFENAVSTENEGELGRHFNIKREEPKMYGKILIPSVKAQK